MTSTSPNINRWRAFALLAVSYFMTIIDLTIVNVSLPTIGRDLHFTEASLQWVVTAYAITFGGFLLLGGRAADLLGRRRILMLGLALFTAASLACGLATGEAFLIGSRAVQGLGAASMVPAAMSIVMNMFEEGAERNKALGIWGGLAAAGATVGLIGGGLLTRYAGWQYIFYLNIPIGAAALALAPRLVPDTRPATVRRKFDALGAIAGTGGLVLLVDAIAGATQYGWESTRTIALLSGSAALLVAFATIESRAQEPLLPLSIFRLRTLAGANIAALLSSASFFGFIFVGTLYMQQVLQYSALETGVAWLAGSLSSIALAGLSQKLVTRRGVKVVMSIGMVAHWGRRDLGKPGAGRRALHGQPRRPDGHRRRWDRVRVHPDLDRRARRCRRASGRSRVRADEHLSAARRRDRDRDRVKRRHWPRQHLASRRQRTTRRSHQRLSAGAVGACRDRVARPPSDLHARRRRQGPRHRPQDRDPRSAERHPARRDTHRPRAHRQHRPMEDMMHSTHSAEPRSAPGSIPELRTALLGELIAPDDPEYESARLVVNAGVDRRPALIVRPADSADVALAISLARTEGLELAVRGGGHSFAGHGTTDGGLVLDMSKMRALHLDPQRRIAWAQAGLTAGQYTAETARHGLTTGFGDTGSVGITGLTLGGGIGWLVRKHGLTIDDLLAVELVTADGERLQVDSDRHPDLFWALRGGGGNFGVVTRLEYRLHEIDTVLGGMLVLPAGPGIVGAFIAAADEAPDELSTIAILARLPPLPFVSAEHHGQLALMVRVAYAGHLEHGEQALAPLRALATPLADAITPMPYQQLYPAEGPGPGRLRRATRSMFIDHFTEHAESTVFDRVQRGPSAMSAVEIRVLGGAMARVAADATAFSHRQRRLMVTFGAGYQDQAQAASHETWVADSLAAMRPAVHGVHVSFLGDEGTARVHEAYPADTYERLAVIKRRYDPTNLFHVNQNIAPNGRGDL